MAIPSPDISRGISGDSSITADTRRTAQRFSAQGFTLIELLVTLAVAAVLLTMAAPSFRTFVQNSKVDNAADGFLGAIQRARSEAITRGEAVVLCRTTDPASNSCVSGDNKDWTTGWLMYVVPGGGETDYTAADHVLLGQGNPAPQGIEITSDDHGNQWLAFAGDGSLDEGGSVAYAICDTDRGVDGGQLIVIPMIGRPYLTDDLSDAPGCAPNN